MVSEDNDFATDDSPSEPSSDSNGADHASGPDSEPTLSVVTQPGSEDLPRDTELSFKL